MGEYMGGCSQATSVTPVQKVLQMMNEMKATSDIEKYTAEASKADSDVAQLSDQISGLDNELDSTEAAKAEATLIRNEQHAEYVKISTDFESLGASVYSAVCARDEFR